MRCLYCDYDSTINAYFIKHIDTCVNIPEYVRQIITIDKKSMLEAKRIYDNEMRENEKINLLRSINYKLDLLANSILNKNTN